MKIYTKSGDRGRTALVSGKRVLKSELRINTYGTIDELNSFTGYLNSMEIDGHSKEVLIRIQNLLFTIGSNLAMDVKTDKVSIPDIEEEHTQFLENEIDYMEKGLEPFRGFILPGGDQRVAMAHVCRTVCRRAERLYVELNQHEELHVEIGNFINRLSDFYFMMARKFMKDFDVEPAIWNPEA